MYVIIKNKLKHSEILEEKKSGIFTLWITTKTGKRGERSQKPKIL